MVRGEIILKGEFFAPWCSLVSVRRCLLMSYLCKKHSMPSKLGVLCANGSLSLACLAAQQACPSKRAWLDVHKQMFKKEIGK